MFRMKIAYISFTSFSDCDIPFVNELAQEGIDVTYYIIVSNNTKSGPAISIQEIKGKYGIYDASEYQELSKNPFIYGIPKIRIVNMSVAHTYAPSTFALGFMLRKEIKLNKFDLIHITWPLEYPFYSLYTLKIPIVLTVHDPIPHSSNETFRENFKRYVIFKRANKFILLNVTQVKNRYHIQNNKIAISKLGIYTYLREIKKKRIIKGDYILFVGYISPYKGLKYIVKAMKEIKLSFPEIKLVVAGKGTPDFDIKTYMHDETVIFINRFITSEELASLIEYSKFVVCPYTDATQSGVIMSSFALSKPVLATIVGALCEMIGNNKHGMLVPPKDHSALAEAAKDMLQNNTLELMSKNIDDRYSIGENSWRNITHGIIDIYAELIQNSISIS